jgi:hypothetical protein
MEPGWWTHLERVDDPAALAELLPDGVNVAWTDRYGQTWTPLGWAICDNREKSVRWLLDNGCASVEQVCFDYPATSSRFTPLGHAVVCNRSLEILTVLLNHGASATASLTYAERQYTPETYSAKHGYTLLAQAKVKSTRRMVFSCCCCCCCCSGSQCLYTQNEYAEVSHCRHGIIGAAEEVAKDVAPHPAHRPCAADLAYRLDHTR